MGNTPIITEDTISMFVDPKIGEENRTTTFQEQLAGIDAELAKFEEVVGPSDQVNVGPVGEQASVGSSILLNGLMRNSEPISIPDLQESN